NPPFNVLPAMSATPVPLEFTSSRTPPSPVRGPTVTSKTPLPAWATPEIAPARPPEKTGVKSEASTPLTCSLNVTRNVIVSALLVAAVGFWRFTDATAGARVSTLTVKLGDDVLAPPPLLADAANT